MTVTFTPTQGDYVAANRLWFARTPTRSWLRWLTAAVLALAALNMTFRLVFGDAIGAALADSAALLFAGLVLCSTTILNRALLPRQVRRMFAQRPSMADPIRVDWDDEHISFQARTGHSVLLWTELHRWTADESGFVFLASDRLIFFVPRRTLTNAQATVLEATASRRGPPRL